MHCFLPVLTNWSHLVNPFEQVNVCARSMGAPNSRNSLDWDRALLRCVFPLEERYIGKSWVDLEVADARSRCFLSSYHRLLFVQTSAAMHLSWLSTLTLLLTAATALGSPSFKKDVRDALLVERQAATAW